MNARLIGRPLRRRFATVGGTLNTLLRGPGSFAFLPAVVLAGYWLGGEMALLVLAMVVPTIYWITLRNGPSLADTKIEFTSQDTAAQHLDQVLTSIDGSGRKTACFVLTIDSPEMLENRHGHRMRDLLLSELGARIATALRSGDYLVRVETATFVAMPAPSASLDLEAAIQMAGRIQAAIAKPVTLKSITAYATASVGFCLSDRGPGTTGSSIMDAAFTAMIDARRQGGGTIRAWTSEMNTKMAADSALMSEIADALESGEIAPWFQPQIHADTGNLAGYEALARWTHPDKGLIPPGEFLPCLENAGLMEHLCDAMVGRSLSILKEWDAKGLPEVPVGVNFSTEELRNPKLVDKIAWHLDQVGLDPSRLCVEILETVVAGSPDDVIARNIAGLAALGCPIDLDDFGTGHASIASVKQFAVSRLKIDRSFVMKCDEDPEQKRLVSAILTMAEQLEIETLAEGVETATEHATLSQLGCGYIQGFGIARPMPPSDIPGWIQDHQSRVRHSRIVADPS